MSETLAAERSVTRLTDEDLHYFNEGTHLTLHDKLGSHLMKPGRFWGTNFAVWAPDAERVSVVGDFNDWDADAHPLSPRGSSGIWEGFIRGVKAGAVYKYSIHSRVAGYKVMKADPFARRHEAPPKTASVVTATKYRWRDAAWMRDRGQANAFDAPQSIYEVHLGSWRRVPDEDNRPLTYREAAPLLAEHVVRMGFTHVEFMPLTEHPFYGSWGYQTTGYFAPTSRYGSPEDLMFLVDTLHRAGVGVILDWVPSHFPNDEHGLGFFDGTHLFEHADPRQGFHPDWDTFIFNYNRNEVRSFLLSSAVYWMEQFHLDGLRVDAVASMLYLDYSREEGEWIPNKHGGRENLEAIDFIRHFNREMYRLFPDTQTMAEESTAWPMVSRPTDVGGLGFGMKWDMGWMHDTLKYMERDPIHRSHHHNQITFRMIYAFNENFVLPLSHDEVVHGKGSLLERMPGDEWQRFANLRVLYGLMYAHAGKKLLFMGAEFAQSHEWDHEQSLEWHLLQYAPHAGIERWVAALNRMYRERPELHEVEFDGDGFQWIDSDNARDSVLAFARRGRDESRWVVAVFNFTPVPREGYRLGVPAPGGWTPLLNSDAAEFGGSGVGSTGPIDAQAVSAHGREHSVVITVPPLSALFLSGGG